MIRDNDKLKAYIIVAVRDISLEDSLKSNPWSHVVTENIDEKHCDQKSKQYLAYTIYNDLDAARNFAEWWTGNCGIECQVKEVEINIKSTAFDNTDEGRKQHATN